MASITGTQVLSADAQEFTSRTNALDRFYHSGIQAQAYREVAHEPSIRGKGLLSLVEALEAACLKIKAEKTAERREAQKREMEVARNGAVMYINLCAVNNCYGGREEGGWYYDHYEPIASVAVDASISYERLRKLEARLLASTELPCGYERPYGGHGCGGAGDDDGLMLGESFSEGYGFTTSYGAPYQWEGRPHYE